MKKIILAGLLIFLGIAFRTIWHIAPNVEFVTAATFLAIFYLGRKVGLIVPFAIMVLSDTLLGNSSIFVFTWSAYVFVALFNIFFLNRFGKKNIIVTQIGISTLTSFFFFLWTNFGVWAIDSFHMYPHTFSGLIQSYLMGLPFLRLNLVGNIFFVGVTFSLVEFLRLLTLRKPLLTLPLKNHF
jgi:hypothetical protein